MSKGDIRSTGGEKDKMETSTVHFEVDKKGETKKKIQNYILLSYLN